MSIHLLRDLVARTTLATSKAILGACNSDNGGVGGSRPDRAWCDSYGCVGVGCGPSRAGGRDGPDGEFREGVGESVGHCWQNLGGYAGRGGDARDCACLGGKRQCGWRSC